MRKRLFQAILIGLLAALAILPLWSGGKLNRWEYATWSWRAQYFAKPGAATDQIRVILLDQSSLDWGAQENGLPWPWPRSVYVPLIDFCKRAGAKAIAFDVLYTENSLSDSMDQDRELGDAVERAGNFVAAVFLGDQARQALDWPSFIPKPKLDTSALPPSFAPLEKAAAFPIPEIATNAALLASVREIPDEDAIFRRVNLFRAFSGEQLPSLGLGAYLAANPAAISGAPGIIRIGSRSVPVDVAGRAVLRYRGPSGMHKVFTAAQIIRSELQLQENEKPQVDPALFKDCYVLFGFSAPALKDLQSTPISGDYPGVEIHATLLDNLLSGDFLRDVPRWVVVLGTLIPAALAAFILLICRTPFQMSFAFLVLAAFPWVRGYLAYAAGFWWPIVAPELAISLSMLGSIVVSYATEGRQKRFIKSAFNQYVGEEVLDQMTKDPTKLRLGGEKKEITMFFSDLEKFSSFSERLDPPRLIELLNVYLTEMGQVIKQETGGYLDKFVGDAIVAFWNGPVAQPDHAARAVRAAILCQRRLAERRDAWAAQFNAVLKMRIGIGTGEVVVGNMGSADKFNYTMLGDAANASSRLEGANKAFGTYTMASEQTWQQAGAAVVGRELGSIRVVGRKTPMRVYEPMGLAGEPRPPWVEEFERGVAFCHQQKWGDALTVFEKLADDPPSKVYALRCRQLLSGELKAWDGVWNLTEK